ncbi:MAG: TolC family protein [Gemmatimonadales bacterium]
MRSAPITALAVLLLAPYPARGQYVQLDLGTATRLAVANHPSIAAAEALLAEARGSVRAARAPLFPTFRMSGQVTRFQEPMIVAPLHSFQFTNPPTFNSTLIQSEWQASYALWDGGVRSSNIRNAVAAQDMSRTEVTATMRDVVLAVSKTFLAAQTARLLDSAAVMRLAAVRAEHDRATQLFAQGRVAQIAVLRAAAALESARATRISFSAHAQAVERSLLRLIGLQADFVSLVAIDPGAILAPAPEAALATAQESNSAIQRALFAVAGARAAQAAARGTRWPQLSLLAGLHTFGSTAGGYSGEWRAGLAVSYPILTGGARAAEVSRADARAEAATRQLEAVRLQVADTVDRAITAIVQAASRREALARAVELREEVARVELLALENGSGVQSDYLAADSDLFRARTDLIGATNDLITARLELAAAMGQLTTGWLERLLEH